MKTSRTTSILFIVLFAAAITFAQSTPPRPPALGGPPAASTSPAPTPTPASSASLSAPVPAKPEWRVTSITPNYILSKPDKDIKKLFTIVGSGLDKAGKVKIADADGNELDNAWVDTDSKTKNTMSVTVPKNTKGEYTWHIEGTVTKFKLTVKDQATVEHEQLVANARAGAEAATKVKALEVQLNGVKTKQGQIDGFAQRLTALEAAVKDRPTMAQVWTAVDASAQTVTVKFSEALNAVDKAANQRDADTRDLIKVVVHDVGTLASKKTGVLNRKPVDADVVANQNKILDFLEGRAQTLDLTAKPSNKEDSKKK